MAKGITLLLLLATMANGQQWQQEPSDFMGVQFGSTSEQFYSAITARSGTKVLSHVCAPGRYQNDECVVMVEIVGHRVTIVFDFSDDQGFSSAIGTFDAEAFPDLKAVFVARYGKPHNQGTITVQNAFGARLPNELLTWKGKRAGVTISQYGTGSDRGSFLVALNSYRPKRNIKGAAKAL